MFRSLAHLPIDIRFLTTATEGEDDMRRSQMNFSRHCAYAESRLVDLATACNESLSLALNEQESLHWFTAATMCTLLSTSSILSPGGNESSHYLSMKKRIGAQKIIPGRCDEIAEGYHPSWGALYGTLGYYNSLLVEPLSYATPSIMVREAVRSLLLITSTRAGINVSRLLSLLSDPTPEADWLIYSYHVDFLRSLPAATFPSLLCLAKVIPPLLDWYLSNYRAGLLREPPLPNTDSNTLAGYKLILDICRTTIRAGIEWSDSIIYNFVYQSLPAEVYQVHENLVTLISTTRYTPINGADNLLSSLSTLLTSIPPTTLPDVLLEGATTILQSFPPGGYNLLLILLSSELLNRAHILSAEKSSYISERVRGLLHLASILLRKASLAHIRALGWNLSIVARSPYEEPQITDLFKL